MPSYIPPPTVVNRKFPLWIWIILVLVCATGIALFSLLHYSPRPLVKEKLTPRQEEAIFSDIQKENVKVPESEGLKELMDKGSEAIIAGQYDKAIDYADKMIQVNPDYAEAYNLRGAALASKKVKELSRKAIEDFNRAIKLSPDSASAYMNRGTTNFYLGLYYNCIEDQSMCIELSPTGEYVDIAY